MIYDRLFKDNEVRETMIPAPGDALACFLEKDLITAQQCLNVPVIAAVCNLVAGTVSTLPIKLYKIEKDGKTEVNDYRTFLLNEECGDLLSANEMKYELVKDWILTGSGFYYVDWKGNKINKLSYLDPRAVSFNRKPGHIDKDASYVCDARIVPEYQMGRILRDSINGVHGQGIVQQNSDYINMLINIQNLLSRTSKQGGKVIIQPEQKLQQDALNSLRTAWQNLYGSNDGETMMVMNSSVGVRQLEAQVSQEVAEVKKIAADEITSALGIPSTVLFGGASDNDYALFKNNCLTPLIRVIEKSFNRFLLLQKEKGIYTFSFDLDSLTTETLAQRMDGYSSAMTNSVMSINDVRKREGLKTMDKDYYHLNLGSVLWNPETNDIYNVNMGQNYNLAKEVSESEV